MGYPAALDFDCGPELRWRWYAGPSDPTQTDYIFNMTFANMIFNQSGFRDVDMGVGWFVDANFSSPYVPLAVREFISIEGSDAFNAAQPDPGFGGRLYTALAGSYFTGYASLSLPISLPPPGGVQSYGSDFIDIVDTVFMGNPSIGFAYGCEVQLYDMKYTVVNGTSSISALVPANSSLYTAFVSNMNYVAYYATVENIASQIAVTLWQNITSISTPSDFVDLLESSVRRGTVKQFVGMMVPAPPLLAQKRSDLLLTRVPKAPLWTLVSICLLTTLLGLATSCWAVACSSATTSAIRDRLSLPGIVANWSLVEHYDSPHVTPGEALQADANAETNRVRIGRAQRGGWVFSIGGKN